MTHAVLSTIEPDRSQAHAPARAGAGGIRPPPSPLPRTSHPERLPTVIGLLIWARIDDQRQRSFVTGTICCSDGEYPEAVRALAFNGAEVVYRPSEAVPMTQMGMEPGGTWLLQNRAHAHFNNVYMVCPNVGPVYVHPKMEHPYDIAGGNSHVVDYQGNVLGHTASGANTFVAGIIDIEALRQFRTMNLNSNWMKDLRTEIFRRMYEEPVHPKNLWLNDEPLQHADVDEIYRANIGRLVARGSFTPPAQTFPGARYIAPSESPDEASWEQVRSLWAPPAEE
jgi:Carbon-nitrogen hydrolase